MGWEESVLALFDDLEQQAEGLHLVEREADVGEMSLAEYSSVTLASRLHASVQCQVGLRLLGGRTLTGRLAQVGADWLLVTDPVGHEWVLPCASVATVTGLSTRSVSDDALSVVARLTLRSMLRRIASARTECVIHLVDGRQVEGLLGRVGHDFVEVLSGVARDCSVLQTRVIAGVQGRV